MTMPEIKVLPGQRLVLVSKGKFTPHIIQTISEQLERTGKTGVPLLVNGERFDVYVLEKGATLEITDKGD